MTCEEFRRSYNSFLDGVLNEGESRLLVEHAGQCQGCAAYRDAFASLDEDLRRLPELPIPLELVRKLEDLPYRSRPGEARAPWKPEILRALSFAIPAIVAFVAFGELPETFQAAGNILLAFTGTLVFLLSVLRPIFLPGPPLPRQSRRSRRGDER